MAKGVWLAILKRTCAYLNLPVPSYPQSAVSRRDVELFATAWIRFQTVLRNTKDGKPPPHAMVRRVSIEGPIYSFAQTSDGRFLFVLHTAGLQVWCLQDASPTLTSSFEMDIPGDCWSRVSVNVETENSFLVYLLITAQSQE